MPSTDSVAIIVTAETTEPAPQSSPGAVAEIISSLMGLCSAHLTSGYIARSRGQLDDAALYLGAAEKNLRHAHEVLDRYFTEERQHRD